MYFLRLNMLIIVVKSIKIRKCLILNVKLNNLLYDDLMMIGVYLGLYYKVIISWYWDRKGVFL